MKFTGCYPSLRSPALFAAALLVALGGLLSAVVSPATAQEAAYREAAPKWDRSNRDQNRELTTRQNLVRDILNGRAPLDQNRNEFDEYFKRQVFSEMTVVSDLGKLAERRRDFFKTSFQMANPPQAVHDHLVTMTFDVMRAIVNPAANFHPAVRYNAMLMIGELNQQESTGFGGNRQPAVPYAPALEFMVQQLNSAQQIDVVRVAALTGILRHMDLHRVSRQLAGGNSNDPTAGARVQGVISAVAPIAEQKDPPEGRSLDGHNWMRRRAIDILLAAGAPEAQLANILEGIVSDHDAALSLRSTAAEAIGKLPVGAAQQQSALDAPPTAQNVAMIAIDACEAELEWWEKEKKREEERKLRGQTAGGYGGYGGYGGGYGEEEYGGGYPGEMGAEGGYGPGYGGEYGEGYGMEGYPGAKKEEKKKVDVRVEKTQRRLKHHFYCVKLALDGDPSFTAKKASSRRAGETQAPTEGGLLARAGDQQKPEVKQLAGVISTMFLVVDTAEPDRDKILTDLQAQLENLKAMAGGPEEGGPPSGASGPPGASGGPSASRGPSAAAGSTPRGKQPPAGAGPSARGKQPSGSAGAAPRGKQPSGQPGASPRGKQPPAGGARPAPQPRNTPPKR